MGYSGLKVTLKKQCAFSYLQKQLAATYALSFLAGTSLTKIKRKILINPREENLQTKKMCAYKTKEPNLLQAKISCEQYLRQPALQPVKACELVLKCEDGQSIV